MYPFMRTFWLPTLLSPIPEDEESVKWTKFDTDPMEVPDYERIRSRGSLIRPDGVLSNQNQSAPRTLDLERKIIESHSGRKLDSVGVLKQKYINDDIQDIPRIIQGPLRYGRLHRSRSHINLSSQDIRSQINKIRLRMGAIQCGDENSKLIKSDYRCSRLQHFTPAPAGRTNSIEQLLYGCPREDDYDPELAALFEDYVEVCDKPTRVTPMTDYSLKDRYLMGRMLMESALNTETRKAFLSGFLEGINHTTPDEIEALDRAIEKSDKDPKESPKDPCINQTSHIDLIKSNQDITHKFLKEWEQTNNRQEQEETTCFACHQQKASETNAVLKQTDGSTSDSDKNGLLMNDKPIKKRSLLPLGKTELDLAVPVAKQTPLKKTDHSGNSIKKPVLKKVTRYHRPELASTPKIPAIQARKLEPSWSKQFLSGSQTPMVDKGGDATNATGFDETKERGCHCEEKVSNKGDRNEQRSLEGTPFSELQSPCEPQNKDNSWSEITDMIKLNTSDFYHSKGTFEPRSRRQKYANVETADDVSIISLAKQKLENKHMSSTMLEDWFRRKQEQKQMNTDVKRIKREDARSTGRSKSKPAVDSPDLGDLDGWETDTSHLNDTINLHVSSSELLHPVDSTEKFSPAIQTPIESKDLPKTADDSGVKVGRKSTQGRETPTSAKLSDLEDKSCKKGNFETKAFKHRSTFSNDIMKATSLVKLRLTKSCANVPANGGLNDRAFANVPLATCSNYHVNTTFKPILHTKPLVNLSTRLAKRIRNIGRDDDRREDLQQHGNSDQTLPVKSEQSRIASGARIFPIIEHEFNRDIQSPCAGSDKITLPEIRQSPNNEEQEFVMLSDETKRASQQGKGTSESGNGYQAKSASVDLPPISVRSYQRSCTSPVINNAPNNQRIANTEWLFDGQDLYGTGSLAVRAEVCTSPYQFDKCDPNKLMVNARSVPNHHTVCMSCGGINEKIVHASPTSKEERHMHKASDKIIHDHCRSPLNDGKWKLNRTLSDHSREVPKMNSDRRPGKQYPQHIKKYKSEEKPGYDRFSKGKQTKPKDDGMTFNFLGQNIKLKFECEVSVGTNDDATNSSERCKRLQDIAKPTFRDKMKNPVSRETGIYGAKKKNSDLSGFRDNIGSPNRESPYVEYCKRKAIMRCRKLQEIEQELAKITTDIDSDIVAAESPMTSRKFPVLPVKKQLDKEKAQNNMSSCRKGHKETKHAGTDFDELVVKSGRLPLLKAETRYKAGKRIGRQTSTESLQDGSDAATTAKALEVYVETCEMLDREQTD